MSVVFWILMVILILVFLVALFSSTQDNRRNRPFDLLVAVVSFAMIMLLNSQWR